MNRFLHLCALSLWWFSIIVVLLATLMIASVRLGLEYLTENPDKLNRYLNSLTDQPVILDKVGLDWRGAVPIITINHLTFDGDQVLIELDTIELQPLLFQSIIHLDLQLDLALAKTGTIEVFLDQLYTEDSNIDDILNLLKNIANASNYMFSDIELVLHKDGKMQSVYLQSIKSFHDFRGWTLDVQTRVTGLLDQAHIILKSTNQTLNSWNQLDGRAYISLDISKNQSKSNLIRLPEDLQLKDGTIDVWLDIVDSTPQLIQLAVHNGSLTYKNQKYTSVSSELVASRNSPMPDEWPDTLEAYLGMWELYMPHIKFDFNDVSYQYDDLFISQGSDNEELWFSAGMIDAYSAISMVKSAVPEFQETLDLWSINGELRNLYGYTPLDNPADIVARATLNDPSFGDINSEILQISVTKADILVANRKAIVDTDGAERMNIHIQSVYDNSFTLTQPLAKLNIDWSKQDMVRFSLYDTFVKMYPMTALVDLDYWIDVLQPQFSSLMLHITANNTPLPFKDKLIPYKLWSDDISYTLRTKTTGSGMFSGDMLLFLQQGKKDGQFGIALDLHLDTEDANIVTNDYPRMDNLKGSVDLNLVNTLVNIKSVDVVNSRIEDFKMHVSHDQMIQISGHVTDNIQDLRTLTTSYGSDMPFVMPGRLITKGDVAADFRFSFDFTKTQNIDSDIQITFLDNLLYHSDYEDFIVSDINGSFRIANNKLSQMQPFHGRFADKPLVISINNIRLGDEDILRFVASFTMPGEIINRLFAIQEPLITGAGNIDVLLDFKSDSGDFDRLIVESQLAGIEINIPLSLGKKATDLTPVKFIMERHGKRNLFLHLSLKDRIKGTMRIDRHNKMTGWIGLGEAVNNPIAVSEDKLKLAAIYKTIDIDLLFDWFTEHRLDEVLKQNQAEIKGTLLNNLVKTANGYGKDETFDTNLLNTLDITFSAESIGTSNFFAKQARGSMSYYDNKWVVDITSDLLSSTIYYTPDQHQHTIIVDQLIVNNTYAPEDETDDAQDTASESITYDPLATFEPGINNAVHLTIKRLVYNDLELGEWSMLLKPESDGLRLAELQATKDEIIVNGTAFWRHFPHKAVGQQQETTMQLTIVGDTKNLGTSIGSEHGTIETNLSWPASPIGLTTDNVQGTISIDVKDGHISTNNPLAPLFNLVGLLNIEAISKRLALNFSDQGSNIYFDNLTGKLRINNGTITIIEPVILDGPSIGMQLTGTIDIVRQAIDQIAVVQIPIGEALPLASVIAGLAPQVYVTLLVTNYALKKPLTKFTSARLLITGPIKNPKMVLDKLFNVDLEEQDPDNQGQNGSN